MSNTRHFLAVFPAFVVLAEALEGERARPLKWAVLGFFTALQVLFVIRHINNLWVA